MEIQDDRTLEQKKSHTCLIVGTDSFMSGWGRARGGTSYAVWACVPAHCDTVFNWVSSRSDMKRVHIVYSNWRPKGIGHAHIYVVTESHPSLSK